MASGLSLGLGWFGTQTLGLTCGLVIGHVLQSEINKHYFGTSSIAQMTIQ